MANDHGGNDPVSQRGLATDGGTDETAETPLDADLVEAVATDENVPQDGLIDALVVLNASLLGSHSAYEREYEYVTVEGVRGYVVDTGVWESLRDEHDLDSRLAAAAQRTHTEQTRRLLTAAGEPREDIDAGIVVGIDTAEVMN